MDKDRLCISLLEFLMVNTDIIFLFLVETLILALAAYAIFKDVKIKNQEKKEGLFGKAVRGKKSMKIVFSGYLTSMSASLALIVNAEGVDGHRVALLATAFLSLTYLFFLSTWFRNSLLFKISAKLKED